jgi:hypothetical protein
MNPELNIEMAGINRIGEESSNALAISNRNLPWLQDNAAANVWNLWQAQWRDVRILDARNRWVATFNLLSNDLSLPENRDSLKQLFLDAAQVVDTDGDQLPDAWKWHYFQNLSAQPHQDPDNDGFDNLTEFIFGTNPLDAHSFPSLRPRLTSRAEENVFEFTLRRRAGAYLNYVIEFSTDLRQWNESPEEIQQLGPLRNLFDGTGTVEATFQFTQGMGLPPEAFLRVRVVP